MEQGRGRDQVRRRREDRQDRQPRSARATSGDAERQAAGGRSARPDEVIERDDRHDAPRPVPRGRDDHASSENWIASSQPGCRATIRCSRWRSRVTTSRGVGPNPTPPAPIGSRSSVRSAASCASTAPAPMCTWRNPARRASSSCRFRWSMRWRSRSISRWSWSRSCSQRVALAFSLLALAPVVRSAICVARVRRLRRAPVRPEFSVEYKTPLINYNLAS